MAVSLELRQTAGGGPVGGPRGASPASTDVRRFTELNRRLEAVLVPTIQEFISSNSTSHELRMKQLRDVIEKHDHELRRVGRRHRRVH